MDRIFERLEAGELTARQAAEQLDIEYRDLLERAAEAGVEFGPTGAALERDLERL